MGCNCGMGLGAILVIMGVIGALPGSTLPGVTDLVALPLWYAGIEILLGLGMIFLSMKNGKCMCCK